MGHALHAPFDLVAGPRVVIIDGQQGAKDDVNRRHTQRQPKSGPKVDQSEAVDELGECGYDSLLYGTGKDNRVVVRQVLNGSAADLAGIQAGDTVLRYNDNRVWAASDLSAATSRGERGETVFVDIERQGERLRMRVERGPFGLYMRQERVTPDGC